MAERVAVTDKKQETEQKRSNIYKRKPDSQFPESATDRILQLQKTAGNQAVQKLIKSGTLQAKLKIGQPNDVYEQEADRVAEQVMRMPDPVIQRKCATCDEDEEKIMQAKELPGQVSVTEYQEVPSIVREVLRSPGQPLDPATRAFMEPRFGHDFSNVRVHSSSTAEKSARDINAQAYTLGRNVVFVEGQYAPETTIGKKLLAHELTHVVQQASIQAAPLVQLQLSEPPAKLITESDAISFPKEDENTLDKLVKIRQDKDLTDEKGQKIGKRIGKVTYRNLPNPETGKKEGKEANLERRAVKHALMMVSGVDIDKKASTEMHVRVPLEDSPAAVNEYAMVVIRFDKQRNVEVEYAGKDKQAKGATSVPSIILNKLASNFSVTFVTDSVTAKLSGDNSEITYPGKKWSSEDAELLQIALPLLGSKEKEILKGCKIRRSNAKSFGVNGITAGFYSTNDRSINLSDLALPIDKEVWFGEGGKFFTHGIFTVLHEIGHALHFAKVGSSKGAKEMLDLFKKAVLEESKKRTKKVPGTKFPPPGIITPTYYAAERWGDFYAETYSIYITNPSFLKSSQFEYLYDFFQSQFPKKPTDEP
jgi:hypothetical protein